MRNMGLLKGAKRMFALALTSAVLATALPGNFGGIEQVKANAYFEKNKDNTCIGTSKINKAAAGSWDYVLYGRYENNPFKARVLSKNISNDTSGVRDFNDDLYPYLVDGEDLSHKGHEDVMLLDSLDDVGKMKFGEDSDRYFTSVYSASLIRNRLDNKNANSIFSTAFSNREQNAMPRMKRYDRTVDQYSSTKWIVDGGVADHVFILGLEDFLFAKFGYGSLSLAGKDQPFWTRAFRAGKTGTDNWDPDGTVVTVNQTGGKTYAYRTNENYYVYPAFCIDSENVMFSTAVDKGLGVRGATYKLTIIDPQMNIAVSDGQKVFRYPGTNSIIVPYKITGAGADKAEYVSALVLDSSDNIVYYENKPVATNSNSGTVTFDIPNSVNLDALAGANHLYILAEDINDSETTDYSSGKVEITSVSDIAYIGDGNTSSITATAGSAELAKLTIIAPKDLVYDGKAKKAQTNNYDESLFPGEVDIAYYEDEVNPGNKLKDRPVEVGRYVARLSYENKYFAAVEFVITGVATVTAPTAKSLKDNGTSQQLVNAGTAKNGTIKYALGTGNKTAPSADKFTTAIPTGKAEGTYYVWYRVDGNANYSGIAAKCVTVTIAHSHNLKKFAAKAATESAEGNKEYYYCDKCKKYFSDAEGKNEIAKDSWIIKKLTHKHKLVHVAAKAATANKAGNKEYWKCSGCGKFFSDAKGTKEIKKNSWVIPKKTPKKKGTKITDKNSKGKYVVTSKQSQTPTVSYTGATSSNLKSVSIPATIKYDGITYKVTAVAKGALKNKKKLTKVTIGKNVKSLGAEALSGCTGLKTLTIGANVTSIGDKALYNCTSLESLTLPVKTQKLGKQFAGKCKKLKKLTIKCTTMSKSTISDKAFTNMPNSAAVTVYVPKNKVSAYTSLFRKKGLGKKVKVKKIK